MEPPVGRHDVVGGGDGVRQGVQVLPLLGGDPHRRPLGRLTGEDRQDGKVVDRILGTDPDDGDPAAGRHVHEAFVGELEQRLADGSAAGAELPRDLVEVESGTGWQAAGENPVA